MSMGELFIIGVIILLVVPPDDLPKLARQMARFWNDVRRSTHGVWEEIKRDTYNPVEDLKAQKKDIDEYMKFIGSPDHKTENAPQLNQENQTDMTDKTNPAIAANEVKNESDTNNKQ